MLGHQGIKAVVTAMLICLLFAGPAASAQDKPVEQAQAPEVVTLATIKVTAEKRDASAQETAVSITTISENTVEDAQLWSTEDLVRLVPNLHMVKTGNHSLAGFLAIRGITSWMGGEPTVGFYIDDVYYSNYDTELLDVERIEVLKGPQGTLYGRNTEAGVVNVVSAQPAKEKWEGMASASLANYNTQMYRAHVTGPVLDDKLFIRMAAKQTVSDGYFKNTYLDDDKADDLDDFSARLTALWTPSDAWDIEFSSELMRFRDGNASFAPLARLHENPNDVSVDYNGYADYDATTQRVRLKYRGSSFNATAITAYRKEENKDKNDLDFSSMDLMRLATDTENDMFSQEIRFSSPDDGRALQWLTGAFFFNEKRNQDVGMETRMHTMLPPFTYMISSDVDVNGYALFGQCSYRFFDALRFTLGLRYDHEDKEFNSKQYYSPDLSAYGMTPTHEAADASWNELLPKFSVDYTFRKGLMAYASVAKGYKSGGFNSLAPASYKSYDPEYTTNYEVGLKSSWTDDRLVINLALFHIDWTDQQIEQQAYPQAITKNAGESTSQGLEIEMAAKPMRGLELSAGFGYVQASFDDYTDDILDGATGQKIGQVDYAGNDIPNVPEYTFNLAAQYNSPRGLFARVSLYGVGPFYWDAANTQKEDAYETVDAKLGWEWERLRLYLWGKNLFDKDYVTRAFELEGVWYGRAGDPATYGITLEGRF